ncbi:hypothetical protein [Neorhizobium sp. NCHU2750]|uniref:hypothetical protein n=1 Tax=Neorhizobium sp. NCHU2750 TaxID=1825976 RepID=UPI000EB6B59C|nr:hypothetical protein NCHU2750_05870 [Neorhizobium sp. NCHU2750]
MSLLQSIRCKLGKHLWKPVRNRHWVQSECVHCGSHGATHFIPLMKSVDDCEGFDDPDERCPRHPNDCLCWDAKNLAVPSNFRVSEGMVRKGGINSYPSNVISRPDPPGPTQVHVPIALVWTPEGPFTRVAVTDKGVYTIISVLPGYQLFTPDCEGKSRHCFSSTEAEYAAQAHYNSHGTITINVSMSDASGDEYIRSIVEEGVRQALAARKEVSK